MRSFVELWIYLSATPLFGLTATLATYVAAQAGGHATLFRAQDKSPGAFAPLAPPLERIHRELKRAFDPAGIFNRGRLVPGL